MIRRTHAARVVALAIAALFACVVPAAANTQQWSEPDESVSTGGEELDLQSVAISQNATEALFEAEIQYPSPATNAPNDQVQIFVDTNQDGNADRAVGFVGLTSGNYTVEVREVSTTPANCQRLGNALYTSSPIPMPSGDTRLLQAPFPASHLGASSYKWAAYVLNDSLFTRPTWDYLPNEANPTPGKPNPFDYDYDGCDTNGDGTPDASTISDRAFPVDMTKGYVYGTATNPGGGSGGGGGGGGGDGQSGQELDVIPPKALVLPDAKQLESTFELPPLQPYKKRGTLRFVLRDAVERSVLKRARGACKCEKPNILFNPTAVGLDHTRVSRRARKALQKGGKAGSVVHAIVEPDPVDNRITAREGGDPVRIRTWHWDPARDVQPKREVIDDPDTKREKEIKARYKKLGCAPLAMGDQNEAARLFITREWFPPKNKRLDLKDGELSAIAPLEREKCRFEVVFKRDPSVDQPYVKSVKLDQSSRWVMKFVVLLPKRSDYFLTLRDDPGRAKSGDLGLNGDNWTLPAVGGQSSIFTISVNEIASGRFVKGATVNMWFAPKKGSGYGQMQKVASVQTGQSGEVFFRNQIKAEGLIRLVALVEDGSGEQALGFREIEVVKPAGSTYRVTSGRTLKKSGGKWKDDQKARFTPLEPASLGIDSRATGRPKVATLGTADVGYVVPHQGARAVAIGDQNVLAMRGENVLVAMRPKLIVVGSGNFDVDRLGPDVTYDELTDFMNAIVTPLSRAVDRQTGTVERLIPPNSQLHVDLKQQSSILLGLARLPLSDLISDKGLGLIGDHGTGIISDNGGGIISEAGGSLINTSQGSLIGEAGGNLVDGLAPGIGFTLGGSQWISNNTGNFINNNTGTFVSNNNGNFIPLGGGRIISRDGAS